MNYVEYIYNIIKNECSDMPLLTKDFIIQIVGSYGFIELLDNELIEYYGTDSKKSLYVLIEKEC